MFRFAYFSHSEDTILLYIYIFFLSLDTLLSKMNKNAILNFVG